MTTKRLKLQIEKLDLAQKQVKVPLLGSRKASSSLPLMSTRSKKIRSQNKRVRIQRKSLRSKEGSRTIIKEISKIGNKEGLKKINSSITKINSMARRSFEIILTKINN